jgi:hypothetical protein
MAAKEVKIRGGRGGGRGRRGGRRGMGRRRMVADA